MAHTPHHTLPTQTQSSHKPHQQHCVLRSFRFFHLLVCIWNDWIRRHLLLLWCKWSFILDCKWIHGRQGAKGVVIFWWATRSKGSVMWLSCMGSRGICSRRLLSCACLVCRCRKGFMSRCYRNVAIARLILLHFWLFSFSTHTASSPLPLPTPTHTSTLTDSNFH